MSVIEEIKRTIAYRLVANFYGKAVANRSQVPLINHIDEGLSVLDEIGASIDAMQAWCIHPMLQEDTDLEAQFSYVARNVESAVVMLAMEYRSVANEYLSGEVGKGHSIRLSPLNDVNDMLIADKVQNRKDFYTYHYGTHPRSAELEQYFKEWLTELCIDEDRYLELCAVIDADKVHNSEIQELRRKNRIYESVLHRIQMCEITGDSQKVKDIVHKICDWSYAHRSGNGELSEDEENERIEQALQILKDSL